METTVKDPIDDNHGEKYGLTYIRDREHHNLLVGWNFEAKQPKVIMVFTPDLKDPLSSYHIELTVFQAQLLENWIASFLNRVKGTNRKKVKTRKKRKRKKSKPYSQTENRKKRLRLKMLKRKEKSNNG